MLPLRNPATLPLAACYKKITIWDLVVTSMFIRIQLYKIDFKGKCCDLFQFEILRREEEEKAAMRRREKKAAIIAALGRRVSKSRNWKNFVIYIKLCGDALVS